jgi:excisionase family DNA binding protein
MQNELTAFEVAIKYRVSLRTVRSWVETKRIGHLKIGRLVRFTPAHLQEFEKNHNVKSVS